MTQPFHQQAFKMPMIVRARGYRLYDLYGKRYLDLFQNNGRAILGHRPEGLRRSLKSTVSRGLICEYPSVYDGRLEKVVKLLFPDYNVFRIYKNRERAFGAVEHALDLLIANEDLADPAVEDILPRHRAALWRPFLPETEARPDFLFPVFPFPGSFAPEVVCVKSAAMGSRMPPSDMVSPFLADGMVKVLSQMIRSMKGARSHGSAFQRLTDVFDWKRRGPYIQTGLDPIAYGELFKKALSEGILLPPGEHIPIIVPLEFSEGELEGFTRFVHQLSGE